MVLRSKKATRIASAVGSANKWTAVKSIKPPLRSTIGGLFFVLKKTSCGLQFVGKPKRKLSSQLLAVNHPKSLQWLEIAIVTSESGRSKRENWRKRNQKKKIKAKRNKPQGNQFIFEILKRFCLLLHCTGELIWWAEVKKVRNAWPELGSLWIRFFKV